MKKSFSLKNIHLPIASFLLLVCAAATTGCNGGPGDDAGLSAPPPTPMASDAAAAKVANRYVSTTTPGSAGYLIGPQDILAISVFKAPDLSGPLPVSDDGTINMPLIGLVPAAGRSPADLERVLQKRLDAGYMRNPQVTVVVKEYNSQRVTLEGAVKAPGVFPIRGDETLEQAIAKAGGIDRNTSSDSVVVFRTAGGARTMIRYDLGDIRKGSVEDPPVQPGDVIVVEDSSAKTGLNLVLKVLPLAGYAIPFI